MPVSALLLLAVGTRWASCPSTHVGVGLCCLAPMLGQPFAVPGQAGLGHVQTSRRASAMHRGHQP